MLAIHCQDLTKYYGSTVALREANLEVRPGEVFGFLGPNGAGKTTFIRCLLGMIRPNKGELRVFGHCARHESVTVRSLTGYLPGELRLDESLTARQALNFFRRMRSQRVSHNRIESLSERLRLKLDEPIQNLSKGNKQKVGIVQALMHEPPLLVLDEPTSGLDPLMQQEALNLIREAKERGTSVFLSSHQLSETQHASDRVAMIRDGLVVESGVTKDLLQRRVKRVRIRLEKPVQEDYFNDEEGLRLCSQQNGTEFLLEVDGNISALLCKLTNLSVTAFEMEPDTLDDVFFKHYQECHK
jgi:ABC-2 type transport system ATP-binding protein